MSDSRISCHSCRDLGRCNAPVRAHPDLLRRCEHFMPKRGAVDQRTGRQRYPEFMVEEVATATARAREGFEKAKSALTKKRAA